MSNSPELVAWLQGRFASVHDDVERVNLAAAMAIAAHEGVGQTRKYTGEPYWVHCRNVARTVSATPGATTDMVCAAWLHDTLEDTQLRSATIASAFGVGVGLMVINLSDMQKPADGNRAARMANTRAYIRHMCSTAEKTIKLADLIDNTSSIVERDPGFARVYMAEKRLLLDEALREGDPGLWARANDIVEAYYRDNP